MCPIANHLNTFGMRHITYFFHGHYLPYPVDHMGYMNNLSFRCDSVFKSLYNLFVILYWEIKTKLLINDPFSQGPLPIGLYHVRIILLCAYNLIPALQIQSIN